MGILFAGLAGAGWTVNAGQFTQIDRYQSTGTTSPVAQTFFGYDGMGRLNDLDHKTNGGATLLAGYDYVYDAASRITSIVSSVEGTSSFTYDVTNQVTAADHTSQPDENYSFDLNGNRTMAGHTVIANNRLSTDGTYNYTYDNEGNMLSRTKISGSTSEEYAWDHRNRLVKVTFKDGMGATTKTVEHSYDVYNRWIRRTVDADGPGGSGPTDTFFSYDGYHAVLQFDGTDANDIDHRYLFGPAVDQILADQDVNNLSSAGNTLWGLADHLGTVRDVADTNEGSGVTTVTNHRTYNSFGTQVSETNAAVDYLFGETGKMLEEHTGMNNHVHRWLRSGQWLSEDPIGFGGGDANLRRDVGNHPTISTDPLGLADVIEVPGGGIILRHKNGVISVARESDTGHTPNPVELAIINANRTGWLENSRALRHACETGLIWRLNWDVENAELARQGWQVGLDAQTAAWGTSGSGGPRIGRS